MQNPIVVRFELNLLFLAGLWAFITQARADSWIVGVPFVVLGAIVSTRLAVASGVRLNAPGLSVFAFYFLRSSLLSGIDVTWRSLHPRLPIHPSIVEYPMRLPEGPARTFFMAVVSLLPGTVSADIRGDFLQTHVIDDRKPIRDELDKLERVVAGLFAIPIERKLPSS
jgi:multicomponent Na+:H+ antiporter subunit E